ncbi:MAG: LysM peptidoglycan-binding domain-containing protein [Limosilactobacillus fermentum]|uniref:aggregation-promoting factor n=1 Tax=Limosilactobacillus fermentum TaxID=1613 RepID=UPI00070D5B6B|nr:LysM peptidoglycan-binding domain-containing protein [Limosilactobacillus fermentum]AMS08592.1 peptidase M23 [Limosilactobacillus oris]KRN13908.1 extracellular surface protein [Limosilactobacillus fermentum]MCH5388919.1 LysM peptidoglycan-binding domain-containing protein [Limosilactobacillus fermentum]MCH5393456.1 LysM peptidoglycan-binding domain-containing protein [Limosilactobacillus fermentum]MDU3492434.1 LysM peptidoglycan-binding domain-containing protein [Limosilactobacillus ferment
MLKKNLLKISATLGAAALGVAATASVANADTVYTVQSGDTLSGISQKFANNNSLVDSLAKNNNIQNINLIYVGQQLLIKDNGEITQATQAQAQTLPSANTTSTASSQASTNTAATTTTSSSDDAAKAWIAARESGGSYTAQNGNYYGKYQLSRAYLGGDYSAANQERVANQYVASRYGSWSAAKSFWLANGWY